jgi:TPP-dependent pyruvate/acetoin dehydrogenase alpha subunit
MSEARLYYEMLRIRMIEEALAAEYPKQEIRTPIHLSPGQEACAVGVCSALSRNDLMVSTHRAHAHYLAKGGNLSKMFAEFYGKSTGYASGFGASMHMLDLECGFYGSTSIVGGTIPIGGGLAFSKKLKMEPGIVVTFFGDAAVEEGVAHETFNFAGLKNLPALFVLENNRFSCYTHIKERQPDRELKYIAMAHGLGFDELDGNDIKVVCAGARAAALKAAQGAPQLLVLNTYRQLEHCGGANDDQLGYRGPQEIKEWLDRDPLAAYFSGQSR